MEAENHFVAEAAPYQVVYHYVRNHPLINSDQLDQYFPAPEDSRRGFRSAFNDASFHKCTVHWQPCPLSRKSLERAIQQIIAAELPRGEHLIGYLQDQYQRNSPGAQLNRQATKIYRKNHGENNDENSTRSS